MNQKTKKKKQQQQQQIYMYKKQTTFCFRPPENDANPYAGYQLAYEVKKLMYASIISQKLLLKSNYKKPKTFLTTTTTTTTINQYS